MINIFKLLFGTKKKAEIKKAEVKDIKVNLPYRVGNYASYNDSYERIKRNETNNVIDDVVIGIAANEVIESLFDNSDSGASNSSYDSGFSSGFGGGDYSGGGSGGSWGSDSDSSSYDSGSSDYSSND